MKTKMEFMQNFLEKQQPAEDKKRSKFDYLDGYRGSLCLLVVLQHSLLTYNRTLAGFSQSYSLSGFFMLSAFLLTHRLLQDLAQANSPQQW